MTREEIDAIWGSIADAAKRREKNLPTEQHCIRAMFDAWQRLKELGWNDAVYGPKDGTVVETISVGSTGIYPAHYMGDWPDGHWWVHDAGDLWPAQPALFRLAKAIEAQSGQTAGLDPKDESAVRQDAHVARRYDDPVAWHFERILFRIRRLQAPR
jgi:hypothetical protein